MLFRLVLMEKLDLKDRKILYNLDLNSRQSFRSIGRKVGLTKDAVVNRVKKLQEKGIIKNYYVPINFFRLGYSFPRFYLKYQYANPEIKKEIIDFFVKNKHISIVNSTEGQFDLTIFAFVKNIASFSFTWDKIFNKYRDYFTNQVFSTVCGTIEYKHSYLINQNEIENRIYYERFDQGIVVETDDLDIAILKLLNNNARIPTIEVAEKVNSKSKTISNRINKLIRTGIILAFRVNIDYPKIGYKWYKADIFLKNTTNSQKILKHIEKNPNLITYMKTIGYCDLEFLFSLNNVNQLHQIISDTAKKFPDSIKNYYYTSITETNKYQFYPK